ncbi:amidohydrolase family protein [Polymorphobacter sp.]|uniref:amidohydrolase family protein n=1 Tax=Polymorphobacter sp. TaxID=1909290 RepID=UPI003F6EDE3F
MAGSEGGCVICRAAAEPADPGRRTMLKTAMVAHAVALGTLGAGQAAAREALPRGRFVIEAGAALLEQADGSVAVRHGVSVLVDSDRIEAVSEAPMAGDLPRVRVPGDLLLPGFISGHTHACSATPTRGIIEGGRSFARPLEVVEMLDDNALDALTAYNVAELLLSGCTTHVEMSLSLRQAESYVRVAEKWGVRGYPGGMIPGIATLFPIWFRADDQVLRDAEPGLLAEIAAALDFGRRHRGKSNGRIRPMMAPHATDTQTPATMKALAAAARELGTGIHIHLAQRSGEPEVTARLWGVSPTRFCADHGLMDGPFFAAHLSAFDFATDAPLFNSKGAVYAHCPSASGAGGDTQPWPEALAAGMRTNIGIDTHSNDYLENLKLSVLYGQARHSLLGPREGKSVNPTIWNAIDSATRIAADGLRRPDLGRIKPGAKADLITVDVSGYLVGGGAMPPEPLNNLLYANGKSVRHVMTDGIFQVWDGTLVVDDPARVAAAGGAAVRRIWDHLAAEGWFKA